MQRLSRTHCVGGLSRNYGETNRAICSSQVPLLLLTGLPVFLTLEAYEALSVSNDRTIFIQIYLASSHSIKIDGLDRFYAAWIPWHAFKVIAS